MCIGRYRSMVESLNVGNKIGRTIDSVDMILPDVDFPSLEDFIRTKIPGCPFDSD